MEINENSSIQSANFNERWIQNIYENIKQIEQGEILAFEGCTSLFDYMNIPVQSRQVILGDTQYKNIRFIYTYMKTLVEDLVPILDETKIKEYEKALMGLRMAINEKKRFIKEKRNAQGIIIGSETTPFFDDTLNYLADIKKDIFLSIKHLLFIQNNTPSW